MSKRSDDMAGESPPPDDSARHPPVERVRDGDIRDGDIRDGDIRDGDIRDGDIRDGVGSSGDGLAGFDPARLIRDHQVGVWRYLRSLGCNASLAEDLTQETFLAALQRPFVEYSPAASAGYLRRIAHNLFISHQRRRNVLSETSHPTALDHLAAVQADWNRFAAEDDAAEALAALRRCLEKIGGRARLALDLRYTEKRSRQQIAEALGLSEHGAKNLMQRAKAALRECMQRQLPTDE